MHRLLCACAIPALIACAGAPAREIRSPAAAPAAPPAPAAPAAPAATGRSEEAAREALHEAAWADVTPVPVSGSLPLAGPEGTDADGYPRRRVDRPALRALLLARRFAELTAAVESFQASFEQNPRHERWMEDAVAALGQPHARERRLLDEWATAAPGSFAPYLARASSWLAQGFVYRASLPSRDTSTLEFAGMQEAFAAARRDAEAAIARRARLVEAQRILMKLEVAGGSRERARAAVDAALRICPSCYEIRAEWVGWGLLPRWGGGLDEMAAFVVRRSDPASPMHRRLLGFVDFEHSERALGQADPAGALVALDRACALGNDWRFLRQRAAVKRQLNDHAGRLADLERAEAVRPGIPWVLAGRAWAFADAGRWEEAGGDLLYVLRSEPTSVVGNWLWAQIVPALDANAWSKHEAGRGAEAARLYALATALAPADTGIAERAAIVRSSASTKRGDGPAHAGAEVPVREVPVSVDSPRLVRGRVVVPPGAASELRVTSQALGSHAVSTTDGSFSFPAANRWSRVDVAFTVRGLPTVLRTTDVGDGVTDLGTVVVGPGRRIRGQVLDSRGFEVAGAEVLIGRQQYVEERIAVTRRDGTFEAVVAEGPAALRVRHERWLTVEREVGASEGEVRIALAEGAKLRFRVLDPDGVPVARVPLVLEELRTRAHRGCGSDPTGRCEVAGLPPGEYLLRAGLPAAEPSRPLPPPLWLKLQPGDAVTGIDLVLPRVPSRLSVRVLDSSGNPMEQGVKAFPGSHSLDELFDGDVARLPYFQEARFDNLPPGRYTVVGMGPWGRQQCGTTVVEVAPRSDQVLTLKLEPDGCR